MSVCHGNGPDHCCYVDGQICPWLRENLVAGRRWACALFAEHGSWDEVHADPRYFPIQAHWDLVGIESCGTWGPGTNQCCFTETLVEVT